MVDLSFVLRPYATVTAPSMSVSALHTVQVECGCIITFATQRVAEAM